MLAGLCNLCDDFGHSNLESMELLLDNLKGESMLLACTHSQFISVMRKYQKFLKVQFPKELRCTDIVSDMLPYILITHCGSNCVLWRFDPLYCRKTTGCTQA